jgi:hypothetical protein
MNVVEGVSKSSSESLAGKMIKTPRSRLRVAWSRVPATQIGAVGSDLPPMALSIHQKQIEIS